MISLGPAGLGPVKSASSVLEHYYTRGFRACEIAFTRGPYIKTENDARSIGAKVAELGIALSIHAPYFVNLGSEEESKRVASVNRILECCKIGSWLGAHTVVFHPGYYQKNKESTYTPIKESIRYMQEMCNKQNWNIRLAPETMGKVNVFGSVEEIAKLVRETGCSFCIDFAHILARDKHVDYDKIMRLFPQKQWHVHFSGIVYGDKGEKHHKPTETLEWKELFANLPKNKEITLVNESPTMIEDCIEGIKIAKKEGFAIE
jgi:deoxyribonuclease-4